MKQAEHQLRKIETYESTFSFPPFKLEELYYRNNETIDWELEMFDIPDFWRFSKGKGVKIAIVDSGIAYKHPDLEDAILTMKDFTNSPTGINDTHGHGTHIAGIIAARKNSTGIIGVAPESELIIAKVLDDDGYGTEDHIVEGVLWAIEQGADIISMNFSSPYASEKLKNLITTIIDEKKKFVICSAGNSGPSLDSAGYPAKFDKTIAVGAIDRRRNVVNYSSRGDQVDIVAPGDQVRSTFPPYGFAKMSGTSMAAPFVVGVAALIISKHREYGGSTPIHTQKDLQEHLRKTATDYGAYDIDAHYGHGLINPDHLLNGE